MKTYTLLFGIITLLIAGCTTITPENGVDTKTDKPPAPKFKRHFTQYSNPIAILCEHFTFTKYFSDTKTFDVAKTKGDLHVWGTVNVKKGAFNLTITDPDNNVVFTKEFKNDKTVTVDKIFKSVNGIWIFNITCFDTAGNYQLMAKQL